jgi:hypothetical protein
MNQLFIKFPRFYNYKDWDDIEICNISKICRIRSGIEFLPELLQDVEINIVKVRRINEVKDYEIKSFLEFDQLLRIEESLKIFDERLERLRDHSEFIIEESDLPFGIDFEKHWWWVSTNSGL